MKVPFMPHTDKAARTAERERAKDKSQRFMERFHGGMRRFPLTASQLAVLGQLTVARHPGHALMSNTHVRLAANDILVTLFLKLFRAGEQNPDRRYFFVTLCWDEGFTTLDTPAINFRRMKKQAWDVLRPYGLDGIGAVEVDVFSRRIFDEPQRRLAAHVHLICWTDDTTFDRRKAKRDICAKLPNNLGAPSAKIRYRKVQTSASMAYLAFYLLKPPSLCKSPEWNSLKGRYSLQSRHSGYRQADAVTMMEIWSQVPASQAIFGIGQGGTRLANAYRSELKTKLAPPRPSLASELEPGAVNRFWIAVRAMHGRKPRAPAVIDI